MFLLLYMKGAGKVIDLFKTRLIMWFSLFILSAIIFHFYVFPYQDPSWWYVSFSFFTMFMTMAIFELIITILEDIKKDIKKKMPIKFKKKPKSKVFEFGFFLFLFIATTSATILIAMYFQPELKFEDKLEIIKQNFWFMGLYGVAIAFGIYHYILRFDDDIPAQQNESVKVNKRIPEKGVDDLNLGYLGKIGVLCIIVSLIHSIVIAVLSLSTEFYSIGIGVLSVGIALIAIDLSDSTDKKIKNHLNAIFLQNLNFIEETRTHYNMNRYPEELLSWKTLQGVIVAWGLNKKIRNKSPILPTYQDQLVRYFRTTMKCLFEGLGLKKKKWKDLESGQISNFARAYAMVEDFYAEDKTLQSLNKILNKNMTQKELKDFNKRKNDAKSQLHEY